MNICKTLSLFVIAFVVFLTPKGVLAAEVIHNFETEIVTHQDGTFDVTETIEYDFGKEIKHGIFRDIPVVSGVGDLYRIIEVDYKNVLRNDRGERFSESQVEGKASAKIGKADEEISGKHTYIITYTVKNGIGSNYEDHDELYWNITGNSWQVPIQKVSVTLKTDFGVSPNRAVCFTGVSGSKNQDCTVSSNYSVTANKALSPFEGLTVVWGFAKDTFPDSVLQTTPPEIESGSDINIDPQTGKSLLYGLAGLWLVFNIGLAPYLLYWYNNKKSKQRFGPPAVNFDLPKDNNGRRVTPAEAGSIDIHRVDQNDVIATIFDLAIRKYLKIKQTQADKLFGVLKREDEYSFIKMKDPDRETTLFENTLMHRLFNKGDETSFTDLKKDFYKTFSQFEIEVFGSLISKKLYVKNPKNQMGILLALGIFSFLFGSIILGAVLIFLSRQLNGRTQLGDEMDWRIDGLKLFLKNMSRNYTWQAKNLVTVEKYIPYAIAFGYVKEFMQQLKIVYPDYNPSWYSGNLAFYSITNSMISSMNSSFTTSAPSSSSGFSGGGSSGGGGGGGGGGSW